MGKSDDPRPGGTEKLRDGVSREATHSAARTKITGDSAAVGPSHIRLGSYSGSAAGGGRYVDEAALGTGGMGEVRACRDTRLGRQIAQKRLRLDIADEAVSARFLREARIQGQLEHPAIVPLYDLDESEGAPFFTMKRVRGLTLGDVLSGLEERRPSITARFGRHKLLTAFCTAAQAVHYAHVRGVVHRDLKPHNIMLGDFGEVYVLDWGIAKVLGGEELEIPAALAASPEETATGDVLGTPGYMSPEQVRGDPDGLDERSDVYALGAILFEVLTLKRLNPGVNSEDREERALAGFDVVGRAAAHAPELEPELVAICERATRLEPDARHDSVQELIADIERFLDGNRDAELRQSLSRQHGAAALQLVEQAQQSGDLAERRAATQQVGRALALDPTNEDAMGLLWRLLTEPPQELPPDVEASIERTEAATIRASGTASGVGFAMLLAFLPVAMWMGVHSGAAIVALALLTVSSAAAMFAVGRLWPAKQRGLYPGFVTSTIMIAGISCLFGPLIVVPGMVAINVMGFLLNFHRMRLWPVFLACGAVVAPLILQLAGALPQSYAFEAGTMRVLPWAMELPQTGALLFLLMASIVLIVMGAVFAFSFRQSLNEARRQLHLHSWQLAQLLPTDSRSPSGLST